MGKHQHPDLWSVSQTPVPLSQDDFREALREIIQEIALREELFPRPAKTDNLKVKLEVDTCPPGDAESSIKYHLNPIPFNIRLMDSPYLFAGKVHALLCREWKGGRIKRRVLYDYVWFISQKTPLHLRYLADKMKQSGYLKAGSELD